MVRKRAGWLVFLFLGEMLTATAMGFFEKEIAKAVVLALFVPLIISSGGNSGSQASTLVIRALALGELKLRDLFRVVVGNCSRDSRWAHSWSHRLRADRDLVGVLNIYGAHWLLVALTVAFALVGVVLWGSLVGSTLPFVLRRLASIRRRRRRRSSRRWLTSPA